MISDLFKLSINTLLHRRLRTILTLLGIFIGIAAIVAIISLGEGLNESVQEQFSQLGTDKVILQPKGSFAGSQSSTAALTKKDVEVIERVSGVTDVAGGLARSVQIEFDDEVRYTYAYGVPTDASKKLVADFFFMEAVEGKAVDSGDDGKVLMGHLYKDGDLFSDNLKIRDSVLLNGEKFRVIGFNKQIGNSADDAGVFITENAFRELYDLDDQWDFIVAQVIGDPKEVADNIEDELRKSRGLEEGKEDFSITTSDEFLEAFDDILNVISIFLVGIAGISLLVGGIGILNTMYTSVLERTKVIGVMKAVGARNEDIALLFLFESGLLGAVGGLIGIIIGFGSAKLVEWGFALTGNPIIQASLPWGWVIGMLAFSFVFGSISGVLPALQASKLKPTDALRYE